MLTVKIQLIHPAAKNPSQATAGSAGWDVYATNNGFVQPGYQATIPLGFAVELPDNWQMKVKQRSSMFKVGVITNDSPIDSDYRQEVFALVTNTGKSTWFWNPGDRVGQLLFEPVPVIRWVKSEELTPSARGGGLGSTGR